jgi:hypothetical protein
MNAVEAIVAFLLDESPDTITRVGRMRRVRGRTPPSRATNLARYYRGELGSFLPNLRVGELRLVGGWLDISDVEDMTKAQLFDVIVESFEMRSTAPRLPRRGSEPDDAAEAGEDDEDTEEQAPNTAAYSREFWKSLVLRFAPTGTGRCVLDGTGYAGHAVARGRRWPGRAA